MSSLHVGRVDPYQHRRTSVDDGPSCTPVRSAAGCGTNRGREAVCRAATGRSIVAGTSEYGAGSTLSGTGAAAATARRAISGGAVPCKHRAARPHPLRASPNRACSDAEATGTGGPSSRCTSVGTSSKMRPVALRTPRILSAGGERCVGLRVCARLWPTLNSNLCGSSPQGVWGCERNNGVGSCEAGSDGGCASRNGNRSCASRSSDGGCQARHGDGGSAASYGDGGCQACNGNSSCKASDGICTSRNCVRDISGTGP